MAADTDLAETIADTAAGPASATGDTGSHTAQPIPALIEADRYLAGKAAAAVPTATGVPRSGWEMIGVNRARPGGAV